MFFYGYIHNVGHMETQKNEVRLYYTWRGGDKNHSVINEKLRQCWLNALSGEKKQAILRLLHKTDQDSSLLGLRLLKQCAMDLQVHNFDLAELEYKKQGKPCWPSTTGFDFNISHSDNLVLVVASRQLKVGVDAEKIRPLKRLAFKAVMQPHELMQIQQQPESFFRLWSIKEAVVKAADTAGLSRMREVETGDAKRLGSRLHEASITVSFGGNCWYLRAIDIDSRFTISLATSAALNELNIKHLSQESLLAERLI